LVELASRLFLQLVVILVACRLVGWLGRRFLGQTQVVGEMVAGVLLGPSFLGWIAPKAQAALFPRELTVGGITADHPSMAILYVLSQLGLVLYMFLVGMELDLGLLRARARGAGAVSIAGILAPFLLGGALGWHLASDISLFGAGVTPGSAALYLGASMAITAFPMLARILFERGLVRTRLGTMALAAGAVDDAVAWGLLAVVLAVVRGAPWSVAYTFVGTALFVVVTWTVGRPLLARLQGGRQIGRLDPALVTRILAPVFVAAWLTERLGIYAVFGAFVTGLAMPRGSLAELVRERLEPLAVSLFLPVFFTYSGLNTQIGLVESWPLWQLTAVVVVIAILGKGIACALVARAAGESWRDATVLGSLMNARGLMELIILDIGLAAGLITPTLFTIMVLMAIVTTVMASPLAGALLRGRQDVGGAAEGA
jgi:Kef-type K+ transport system membrane component KefB